MNDARVVVALAQINCTVGDLQGNAARILDLFQKIASQRLATLIMVTHSPEAAAAADRQIPMMDGRLAS